MLAGILLITLGYYVMSTETALYGYGTTGLTVGPFIVVLGFIVEFFAIFYQPKVKDGSN